MEGTSLSKEEKDLLRAHFKTSPIPLVRSKAMAVSMYDKKTGFPQMADFLYVSERTVRRWVNDFLETRMASVVSGKAENQNAAKLTREQKQEIAAVLKQPPSEKGLPAEFWDVPNLKNYLKTAFKVVYESPSSYHFLLEFSGLSFKYPDTSDLHRDEAAIARRVKEIKKEVAPYLKDPEWTVASSDEVRIVLEALTRKAWLKKGERTVVKIRRSSEYQSYIGFLNLKTHMASLLELSWQNQETIIEALVAYAKEQPNKRICLIWDNVSFHKGALLRKELATGGRLAQYHLINFPPYAPDTNPTEKIWNWGKQQLANKQFQDFSATKQQFVQAVTGRAFKYGL